MDIVGQSITVGMSRGDALHALMRWRQALFVDGCLRRP
jgi:hypothetical protein